MKEETKTRSQIMRAVKARDTKPELLVRKLTHGMGFRYILNSEKLPGKPDIVFPKYKKIIFVNGCFWHGHKCKRGNRIPKTNQDYWLKKIKRNQNRDRKNLKELAVLKWSVLTIWECETKDKEKLKKKILHFLIGN